MDKRQGVEFIIGGVSGCGATLFTNPLDVVKVRLQLQGELKSRGQYAVQYGNPIQALWTIGRYEGLRALQRGLVPALHIQFFLTGTRLGLYQVMVNKGLTQNGQGHKSVVRDVIAGALAGCAGACVSSPFLMIRTHLQSQAAQSIAVGHQHSHQSMSQGMRSIYALHGIAGLWRGVGASVLRVSAGSAAQLSTFSATKDFVVKSRAFGDHHWINVLAASMVSGIVLTMVMTPFDVVSTRMYNQAVGPEGRGVLYSGMVDCVVKTCRQEGAWAFYKGWAASYIRFGPYTVLSLVFWEKLRHLHDNFHKPGI